MFNSAIHDYIDTPANQNESVRFAEFHDIYEWVCYRQLYYHIVPIDQTEFYYPLQ